MIFDRFTDRARKVMGFARQSAQQHNVDYIGVEHILLGIALEGCGVGANVLRDLGVSADQLEIYYRKLFPDGSPGEATQLPFTPMAKKLLEYSVEESSNLGHNYVGTEHLLLAYTRMDPAMSAVTLLSECGVTLSILRTEILETLGAPPDDKAATPRVYDPVVTLISRRIEALSRPSQIETVYGEEWCGPRLAVLKELKSLLVEIQRLTV